jgi:hypothetical protein
MQYLENSALGVRAALYTLVRNTGAPQILIFPMVHIGSADYYSQLRKKLEGCDVILFEGVRGLRTRILTLSYRLVAKRARLGLVVQGKSLLLGLPARLVHTDVTAAEFEENWSQIPWRFRLAIVFIAPLYGTYLYFVRDGLKTVVIERFKNRVALRSGGGVVVIGGGRDCYRRT